MSYISFYRSIRTGFTGICMLFVISASDAQNSKKIGDLKQQVEKSPRNMDSLSEKTTRMLKEYNDSLTAASTRAMSERNYDWLSQYQQEKKRKEKKKAMMYIVFGVVGLAIMVYGLSRKRKVS